jgi:hypothetical protein
MQILALRRVRMGFHYADRTANFPLLAPHRIRTPLGGKMIAVNHFR